MPPSIPEEPPALVDWSSYLPLLVPLYTSYLWLSLYRFIINFKSSHSPTSGCRKRVAPEFSTFHFFPFLPEVFVPGTSRAVQTHFVPSWYKEKWKEWKVENYGATRFLQPTVNKQNLIQRFCLNLISLVSCRLTRSRASFCVVTTRIRVPICFTHGT